MVAPAQPRHGDHLLDLLNSHDRESLGEEHEPHPEPAEGAGQNPPVGPCGVQYAPGPGYVVVAQRRDDDDVALEPHPDVDENRDDEQSGDVGPDLSEPEQLGHERVTDDHGPTGPPEGAERPAEE